MKYTKKIAFNIKLGLDCYPRNPIPNKWKIMDGWMDKVMQAIHKLYKRQITHTMFVSHH